MKRAADIANSIGRLVLKACVMVAATCFMSAAHAASCSVSATGVSFGIYNPLSGTANDSTGQITVTCIGLLEVVNYSVDLSKGSSGSYATRLLKIGAQQLSYNLYTATARTPAQIWGDTTSSTVRATGSFTFVIILTPTTQANTLTVYGRIPAGQDVAPGAYTDTITVTVTY